MIERLAPREQFATGLWLVVALVVWNGLYDLLLTRGVKEVLFRAALYEAGRGPEYSMAQIMEVTVRDAVWVCTLWASVILLAGMWTVRMMRGASRTD
jgi:hypothetical protein